MYNLSKYIIIGILSVVFCICSRELRFDSSIYYQYIIIGITCCIYYIIDLIYNNLIEKYDNKKTTYKTDTLNSNTKPNNNSKKFAAGPDSSFKATNEDLKEFGNINNPNSIPRTYTTLESANNKNIFAYVNTPTPTNTKSNTSSNTISNTPSNTSSNTISNTPSNTPSNTNPFNNIIENLKNGLNELDTINNNNCIKVINSFKNKINHLNHYISDINNDLQTQVFNNITTNKEQNNVCPIVIDNNYSYLN